MAKVGQPDFKAEDFVSKENPAVLRAELKKEVEGLLHTLMVEKLTEQSFSDLAQLIGMPDQAGEVKNRLENHPYWAVKVGDRVQSGGVNSLSNQIVDIKYPKE